MNGEGASPHSSVDVPAVPFSVLEKLWGSFGFDPKKPGVVPKYYLWVSTGELFLVPSKRGKPRPADNNIPDFVNKFVKPTRSFTRVLARWNGKLSHLNPLLCSHALTRPRSL